MNAGRGCLKLLVYMIAIVAIVWFVITTIGNLGRADGDLLRAVRYTFGTEQSQSITPQPSTPMPGYTPQPTTLMPTTTPGAEIGNNPTVQPTSGGAVSCMTDSDVMSLFGFGAIEVVRTDAPWDSCKWTRQNAPSTINFVLRDGWGLTYTDLDGNVWVTMGEGQFITARGFTLRQPGNQFLNEGATGYFNREWSFGIAPERGTNTYAHCPDSSFADQVTLTAEQVRICGEQGATTNVTTPVPTATRGATVNNAACPTTTAQVAQMVGGSASNWTAPDWDGGAWIFDSGSQFVTLTVPTVTGASTWIDYWNNGEAKLNPGQSHSLSDASFHCHAQ